MAHFSWPLLYFLYSFPQLGLAGQPSMVSLSPDIARAIPPCAQACVKSFIAEDFPTSTCFQQDLGCLCTSNGGSGFTLGEGSLRCVVSACPPSKDRKEETTAYYICQGIRSAKPMTHETITATPSMATTGPVSSESPGRPQQTSKPSQSKPPSNNPTSSSSPFITRTSLQPSMSDNSSTATTQITTATGSPLLPSPISSSLSSGSKSTSSWSRSPTAALAAVKPVLTKHQIAGVAVAAVASAAALIGLVFFIFYIRRRRSNRGKSGLTFGGKTYDSHPSSPGLYQPIGGNIDHGNRSRDFAYSERQRGSASPTIIKGSPASYWRRSGDVQPEDIGVAVGSSPMTQTHTLDENPKSEKIHRTISQLLPDKPVYSLYPAPLRVNHSLSPEIPVGAVVPGAAGIGQRSATPLSRPAPLGRGPTKISPPSLQRGFSTLRQSASDPFLDSRSSPSPSTYSRYGRENTGLKVSKSDLPTPEMLFQGQWTQSLGNLKKPIPARQSSSARVLNQQRAAYWSISPSDDLSTQPPTQMSIPRKAVPCRPLPRRKSTFRRPATHYSSASETSFEEAGEDDEMPIAPHFLSPVAESPALRSSRDQVTSLRPPISAYSQYGRLPEAESPTRKSARKRHPPPLVTSTPSPRSLKGILKPLPEVPEPDISDSSTPLIAKRRDGLRPRIQTDLNKSPRGETELTKSAKWKILVSPGLQGIDNLETPRSGRSSEWALNASSRRDGR